MLAKVISQSKIKGETKDWLEARGFDTKAYARR